MNQAKITTSIVSPITDLRESPTIEKFKISFRVGGIKRRCRKLERHTFHLGSIDYNNGNYDKEAITEKVKACLETNMKEVVSPSILVSLDHVKIKEERGFTSTLWEPFGDTNKYFDIIL